MEGWEKEPPEKEKKIEGCKKHNLVNKDFFSLFLVL